MNNPVSVIFRALAWIVFIGGFVAGIILGNDKYGDFNFGLAIVYWSAFFVAGMLYYGFAEIIQLLTEIREKESTSNTNNYYTRNYSSTANSSTDSQTSAVNGNINQYKTNTVPYWCGNCGFDGPYECNCPKCGSSLKKYNVKD